MNPIRFRTLAGTAGVAATMLVACADTPVLTYTYRDPRDRITIADQQTEGQARIPTWDGSTVPSAPFRPHHFSDGCANHHHGRHSHR